MKENGVQSSTESSTISYSNAVIPEGIANKSRDSPPLKSESKHRTCSTSYYSQSRMNISVPHQS